ncbi:UNKNOWN [Stylonychia lemnae]|uniref:TRP C-terminal domain-containing protein n=1 Tax=Stylonychia lemnae TaxID=5949 RepID=A0A077ZSB2_STYLE|nr:UNKNOWN [Stylonychia lemnae]|eukprot:CDW72414.1 UNKNOWN [Stylonychia lemnae]
MLFVVYTSSPILIGVLLVYNNQKLEKHQNFKIQFGSLYANVKTEQFTSYLYNVAFILRRLQFAIMIVFVGNYPCIQIMTQIWVSFMCIFYVFSQKPFIEKSDNITEFFNEMTILLVLCFLTTNVSATSTIDTQYELGFFMIGIIVINILVNFGLFLKVNIFKFYQFIRDFPKLRQKWKQQKYQDQADQIQIEGDEFDKINLTQSNYTTKFEDQSNDSFDTSIQIRIEQKKQERVQIFAQQISEVINKAKFKEAKEKIKKNFMNAKESALDGSLKRQQLDTKIFMKVQQEIKKLDQQKKTFKSIDSEITANNNSYQAQSYLSNLIRNVAFKHQKESQT